MLTQEQSNELWSHVKNIPVAMMATLDEGHIRSRPMHKVQSEFSGTLWFFTDARSAKSEEINSFHEVCLSYEDAHKQVYISVSGAARIIRDRALIDKFWNPMVGAWFPEGKDDPGVALIEVSVYQAEFWNATSNRATQLFKIALANAKGSTPDMGEHRKLG